MNFLRTSPHELDGIVYSFIEKGLPFLRIIPPSLTDLSLIRFVRPALFVSPHQDS